MKNLDVCNGNTLLLGGEQARSKHCSTCNGTGYVPKKMGDILAEEIIKYCGDRYGCIKVGTKISDIRRFTKAWSNGEKPCVECNK